MENSKPRFSLLSLEDPDDAGLDSSYLIFETQDCDTDNISGQELKELLEGQQKHELIILMACQSEEIGKLFARTCAKNVICVKAET